MTSLDMIGAQLHGDGPRLVQGRGLSPEPARADEGKDGEKTGFAAALFDALHKVDALQRDTFDKGKELARGETTDVHSLMIAMGKSEVAFNMMLEVRNKIVDAWQTLIRTVV